MSGWTEAVFQRVALNTRMTKRTLDACRDVLLGGMPNVDAAAKHKLLAPSISRSVNTMRNTLQEMIESAQSMDDPATLFKHTAIQVAKSLMGHNIDIVDAQQGVPYRGVVCVNSHGFLVQMVQNTAVIHDLARFNDVPPYQTPITIFHPMDGSKAVVRHLVPTNEKAGAKELKR
jgi:hypothetical protein